MPAADASRPTAETSSQPERGSFLTPRNFFGLLLIYFTLQLILRVFISSSLDLDESEQLVLTQKLSWGYGSQPPLYTWLQFAIFKFAGVSIFSLSLFKNILLFCTYLFTYLNAQLITRNRACAMAASASLLLIPQIAWESQRDLTHSVLAATLVCSTMFCFLRLREKQSLAGYVWFGVCAGLGVLSKYNFALVLVALAFAAIFTPEFRRIIFDKRTALAIVIAALIILPNAMWALDHRDLALRSAGKFKIQESSQWLGAILSGLKGLLVCSVTFFAPFAVAYGIIFWKRPPNAPAAARNPHVALLLRMLLISYALIVVAIVAFRISEVRDRWLQPILISSPLLAIAWLQPRMSATRLKYLLAIAGVVMALVTIALHGRIIWAERLHRTQPWNRPYDALAQQLKPTLASVNTVLTDTTLLAGNLRLNLRDKIFTTPELAGLFMTTTNGPTALVWDAGGDAAARKSAHVQTRDWPPPDNLAQFAERAGVTLDPAQAKYFSATFKFHRSRQMKLGAIALGF